MRLKRAFVQPVVMLVILLLSMPAEANAQAPMTWKEKIEVASGGAYQGPWQMNESVYDYVDDPTIAVNEQGFTGVAWADQARKDIFFQLYSPRGEALLDEPANVSRSPQIFSWLPKMIVAAAEDIEVYILWQEIVFSGGSHGGEIFFARSADGGRTFSEPLNLSNTVAGAGKGRIHRDYWHNGSLDLAMGPQGRLYAAWTEYEGNLWFSRSADRGRRFSAPVHIAGSDKAPARGPSLAVDSEGNVHLAWTAGDENTANIYFTKSDGSDAPFARPQVVSASRGHADAPKIAVDAGGTVHLVYAEGFEGPFGPYHIQYARSTDGGNTFETPRRISGPQEGRFESVHFPDMGLDGQGNPYLLWELFPALLQHPLGLGFTVSTDGGTTFAEPSVIPGSLDPALGSNGSRQGLLMKKLAVNKAGRIAVVNSTFKENEASHIWLFLA